MGRGSPPVRRLCAVLMFIAAVVFWDAGPAARARMPGHADIGCTDCHLTAEGGAGSLLSSQESLCAGCHRGAVEASHPSGFAPARALSAQFPLDAAGHMTCGTCHDIHGDGPRLLRGPTGRAFCLECHDGAFFAGMIDGGESVLGFGHLAAGPLPPGGGLDPYSTRCIDCHADQAPAAGVTPAGLDASNHPLARDYHSAAAAGGFRAPNLLADGILLPGGNVGCVSCHVPYDREHGRLPATRAGLCAECHEL